MTPLQFMHRLVVLVPLLLLHLIRFHGVPVRVDVSLSAANSMT